MNHDDLQSLLGAYALDALDPDEASALEAHLAECPRCRAEVAVHRETVALLANVGGEAPPAIWDRIGAEISFGGGTGAAAPPMPTRVVRFRDRRGLARPVAAALAAAAAALIAVLGVSTIRLEHRVNSLRDAVSAGGLQQAVAAAVLDPHHTSVRLSSTDGRLFADVVIQPDGNAYLVSSELPPLGSGSTYQLWGISGGEPVSLGLLGDSPRLAAFRVDPAVSRLMVTAEPKGGRPQPDSPVLMQGAL